MTVLAGIPGSAGDGWVVGTPSPCVGDTGVDVVLPAPVEKPPAVGADVGAGDAAETPEPPPAAD